MTKFTLLMACLLAPSLAISADVDVFLLGGQSNMQGIGKISDLDERADETFEGVFYWTGKPGFVKLKLGETKTSSRVGEFGPEIGLAKELVAAPSKKRLTYLVKYHASGMPLHHGFNRGKWFGGEPVAKRVNFYPGMGSGDKNRGTLYIGMLHRFKAALEALRKAGHTPVVRGFLWMQGEADAKVEIAAKDYAVSLRRLRDRLAQDLGIDKLPMVFGQVLPHEPAMAQFTHRSEIRASMAAADERTGRPEAIKDCRMISTDGFSVLEDTVHYDAKGQIALGKAFAKELELMTDGG